MIISSFCLLPCLIVKCLQQSKWNPTLGLFFRKSFLEESKLCWRQSSLASPAIIFSDLCLLPKIPISFGNAWSPYLTRDPGWILVLFFLKGKWRNILRNKFICHNGRSYKIWYFYANLANKCAGTFISLLMNSSFTFGEELWCFWPDKSVLNYDIDVLLCFIIH